MYIRKTSNGRKDFNVYLTESYRAVNGKTKQRIIKKYGLLSNLVKENPNAYNELRMKYKKISEEKNTQIQIPLNKSIRNAKRSVNYGYFFLEKIYNSLGISKIIDNYYRNKKIKYDIDKIMKMLIFSRILNPSSKHEAHEKREGFFETFKEVSLQNIYRSLSVMNEIKDDIQMAMHKNIQKNIGRDLTLVLYDLTNYYFETEVETELKKKGVSKERKTTPIVQMGLLIDKNKIPIGYQLFPGNTHDSKTAIPMVKKLKEKFGVKRVIFTADKGINTSKNFAHLVKQGDGYIVSQKVRGSKKEFIDEVLNEEGYTYWKKSFKFKEVHQTRAVKDAEGNNVELKEKMVIFWSENFDSREKSKREKIEQKIEKFLKSPAALNASNTHGIKRYIKTKHLDKKTSEIKKVNPKNIFDQAKYDRDVALDGYYAIVTSELDKPVTEILSSYKELWKIEDSFKVIKSELEGRPVFVKREDRIEGHFLTCFIALTILRILEMELNYKYSSKLIKETLKNATCKEISNGYYSFEPANDLIRKLEELSEVAIVNDVVKVEEVKRYLKTIKQHTFKI